ncbi:MAG: hypothetical protein JST01_09425 [Cyanobacteria bacterium SZAS TMP-1]|nr:hypothetical protein [Cyanobacteria bacterium SZAS TMP-1]
MFYWRDKRSQKDQAEKLENVYSNKDGLNRRAFGLFPQPKDSKPVRIELSTSVNFQKFIVAMEGQEETTCVRLISPGRKVRSAALILRGRVLGCIYGRDEEDQLLGQEAYARMTAEMLQGDIIVDAYKVDDKTAIAASAMFHGELFSAPSTMTPAEVFRFSLKHLLDTKMPGTILINENGATKAVLYTFKGKIHGLFSFQDGWLEPTIEKAEEVLKSAANYSVQASKLLCANIFELKQFTFSMTGLADVKDVKQYQSLSLNYEELSNLEKKNKDSLAKALSESRDQREQAKAPPKPFKFGMD